MAVWPTNPLEAIGADGAFEIGGGDYTFGQDYTESVVRSLFTVPTASLGNAIDILREQLLKLPLEALQGFKGLLPGVPDSAFDTVFDAVEAVMGALNDTPLFFKTAEFQAFLTQLLTDPAAVIGEIPQHLVEGLQDALTGLQAALDGILEEALKLIREALTGVVNATPGDLDNWLLSLLTGASELDAGKLTNLDDIGQIAKEKIDGLEAALSGVVGDAQTAIRSALTGIVDATPTDLDNWLLKLITPESDIVQNLPIPNVGGLPDVLYGLSEGVSDIKNAITNLWAAVPTPVIPQDPNTTIYSTVGTHTFTVPSWMLPGDKIQLVGVGGGHNAPLAFSGKAGKWGVAQVVVGTGGITAGSTFTVTVGHGGERNTAEREGGDSSVTFGGSPLMVATRGQEPNVGVGEGAGDQIYDGITYYGGGTQIITAADGNAPGGGGCGGPYGFFGGGGARGQVWIRVVQTITSGTLIDLAARVSGVLPIANGGTGADNATQARINLGAEPVVAAGTNTQFYRGDKTWQSVTKANVGLGNVDNTSDANKPISTATQTALNDRPTTSAVLGYAAPITTTVVGSKNGTLAALTLWVGTAAQYAAIGTKNADTIYVTT
ncbi:hypothetical protein PBI_TOAKA_30 [Mycobacterium phage Toaka]|nr:hypothetical protein PBI_TOAKA_30 [Mycobacterium phage Toaka]